MVEFERCWACDRLASYKEDSRYAVARLEFHHVFGKNDKTIIPLCVLCHDIVDRLSEDNISVFSEWMKVIGEFDSMPRGKYPMTKLMILKFIKIMNIESIEKQLEKSKNEVKNGSRAD